MTSFLYLSEPAIECWVATGVFDYCEFTMPIPRNPLAILKEAIKQVSAVKYALGLAGIAAAGAIIIGFLGKGPAAIIIMGLTLIGMVLLFLFSTLVSSKSISIKIAGHVLLWAVLVFFITFMGFTVSAFAGYGPERWAEFLKISTPAPALPPLPRPNVFNGEFHQEMLEEPPLGLHGITIRNNGQGTAGAKLIVSIEEVTPTCTPEGSNGHVRARLNASIDFDDGTHDNYILRDFAKNPENYKSLDHVGPLIGPRVPRRITLSIEGQCGPEQHDPLYSGEQPT
jgi:hypothetical protein